MKKIGIILPAVIAGLFISSATYAQDNKLKLEVGYNVSAPLGQFKNNYISNTSFNGFTSEVKYAFNPKFSLGLNMGYQNYYQKYGREVYKMDNNQTISAVVTNNMEIMPLLVRGTYFPMGGALSVQPYLSGGAGINFVNYGQYLGEFGGAQSTASFAAQAGAGVLVPFGKTHQSGVKLGATYNYVPYNKNDISNLNNVGANIGVVFALK
jgi:hypothetical protein